MELPHRIPGNRTRALLFVLAGGALLAGTVWLAIAHHPAWWALAMFWVFGLVGVGLQGFHPASYLELDQEGFTVSCPTVWGRVKAQRFLWRDCRNFALMKQSSNTYIAFDHAPTGGTLGGRMSGAMFGRDAAFAFVYAMPARELIAHMADLAARGGSDYVGVPRPRPS